MCVCANNTTSSIVVMELVVVVVVVVKLLVYIFLKNNGHIEKWFSDSNSAQKQKSSK